MQITSVIAKMGRNDAKIITRDSFLIVLFAYGVATFIAMRLLLPPITDALLNRMDFDLAPYYPLLIATAVLHQVAAVLGGTIVGFLLIDERDNNTITALMVTPVSMGQYVVYRVILPIVFCVALGLVGLLLLAPFSSLSTLQMLILSLLNGGFAALVTLTMATFASNKVEGFALIKIVGSLIIIVLAAWWIPTPWQFLLGFYPPFWTMKAYWLIEQGQTGVAWASMGASLLTHSLALAYLIRRFTQAIYQV